MQLSSQAKANDFPGNVLSIVCVQEVCSVLSQDKTALCLHVRNVLARVDVLVTLLNSLLQI